MDQYWRLTGTVWPGLLTGMLAAGSLCAQNDAPKDYAIFAGRVVDSVTSQAVAKAAIHLEPLKTDQPGYSGRAGIDGAFHFEAVAPGDYHVEVSQRAYTTTRVASLPAGRDAAVLHFEARQKINDASFLLEPEAIVSGRITDGEGNALPDAAVSALEQRWVDGLRVYERAATIVADSRGAYRMKLPAGKYFLTAGSGGAGGFNYIYSEDVGKPEMRIDALYYPGGNEIDSASPLDLQPGQQMSGIDFKLAPAATYHVRGVLASYVSSSGPKFIYLRTRNGDHYRGLVGGNVERDGSFDFAGTRPGSYWLDTLPVRGMPTSRLIPIDVVDHDVNGVRVPSVPLPQLKGRVRFEVGSAKMPLPSVKLLLQQLDWATLQSRPRFSPDDDGAVLLNSMLCREYVLRMESEGAVYVKSVTLGGQAVDDGRIDLRNGVPGDLDIVLGTDTGDVAGSVRWPESVPGAAPARVTAARAVLVSADGHTSNTGARSVEIGADGAFQFHFVPPGKWLLFAAPSFDAGLWQNMSFVKELQGRGAAVELGKSGTAHAEVAPLAPEEIVQAITRVKQ